MGSLNIQQWFIAFFTFLPYVYESKPSDNLRKDILTLNNESVQKTLCEF